MSQSNKHTPGPWHYQEAADPYTHIVRDAAEKYICGCSQDTNGSVRANARLIAAAPDLLELARMVAQHTHPRGHRAKMKGIALELIAKAEGR